MAGSQATVGPSDVKLAQGKYRAPAKMLQAEPLLKNIPRGMGRGLWFLPGYKWLWLKNMHPSWPSGKWRKMETKTNTCLTALKNLSHTQM